jgi:hypothetical protein
MWLSKYLCIYNLNKSKGMAGKIINMSKIKQMLQLYQLSHSNRKITQEIGMDKETVNNYIRFIKDGNMQW